MDIHYTEDLDTIPSEGVAFYNDPDETTMELYKDGKLIVSCFIVDFCEEIGKDYYNDFQEDKCLIYDLFIDNCYKQGWMDT